MPKILVLDDDSIFRTVFVLSLERMGHEVVAARDGNHGLQLIGKESFDIAIVDLIMPEKEGIETIQEIRRARPEIKIIAMSGGGRYTSKELLKASLHLGADRAISKPFTNEAISFEIAAALGIT